MAQFYLGPLHTGGAMGYLFYVYHTNNMQCMSWRLCANNISHFLKYEASLPQASRHNRTQVLSNWIHPLVYVHHHKSHRASEILEDAFKEAILCNYIFL